MNLHPALPGAFNGTVSLLACLFGLGGADVGGGRMRSSARMRRG